jgi:Fe2+ transport system protein FeoA
MNATHKWKENLLSAITEGETVMVTGMSKDGELSRQLADMGILPGTMITVVSGSRNRPFILEIFESRMGITWGMAEQIFVTKL